MTFFQVLFIHPIFIFSTTIIETPHETSLFFSSPDFVPEKLKFEDAVKEIGMAESGKGEAS